MSTPGKYRLARKKTWSLPDPGSVGAPKQSLSALRQTDSRQGLNLQEVYRAPYKQVGDPAGCAAVVSPLLKTKEV